MATQQDNWEAVKALFEAALEETAENRSAFLKQRCADASVCAEVERLLAEHDRAGSFLSTSPLPAPPVEKRVIQPPRTPVVLGGRFRIDGVLGSGGMGVVYKAADLQTGDTVAVKMLNKRGSSDRRGRMGLVREARTMAQLRHPHIVRVHDIGQHKGYLYIVMEYLDGWSLGSALKARPVIALKHKLLLMLQLCSGLAQAHKLGIIHRDIKPANIFIPRKGPIKIVDFGLAKLVETVGQSVTRDTKTGIAGTLPYMSPEQLNGLATDHRTDIWSTGITFYEVLAYRLPFTGAHLFTLAKSIENYPLPPLDSSIAHAAELTNILNRALAKSREQRYPTIEAFSHDLVQVLIRCDGASASPVVPIPVVTALEQVPEAAKKPDPRLNLGFTQRSSGRVRFQELTFKSTLSHIIPVLYLMFAGVALFTLLGWFRSSSIDGFGVVLGVASLSLLVPLWLSQLLEALGLFPFLAERSALRATRRCRTCRHSHMSRASKWTRYFTSNAEIAWGRKDCIAALQEGCYEDAAKLLLVHGSEDPLIYSVIRYNLEFWECQKCSDQAALLSVEEKIDSKWLRQDRCHQSYKYADGKAVPIFFGGRIRCPRCQWRPRKEDMWGCQCGHRWNAFDTSGVCPACSYRWEDTACLGCGATSRHSTWYEPEQPAA